MNNIKTICVSASKKYDIIIARGLLKEIGEIFLKRFKLCKIAIITDDVVDKLYADGVQKSLENSGFNIVKFVFPNGEASKNINTYSQILSFLARNKLSRTDLIIALGGGVVGDIVGFSASSYLRGIKYVQVPTTLLSQIDSSVGGKTAIDLPEGKNLVGAFYQPELVVCDTQTLDTLKRETFLEGMGEGAKYLILDKRIFELVEKDNFSLEQFIYLCIDYKRQIVEQDEFEHGCRKLLNLGHTIAHGIEKLSSYKIAHGKAVAKGLLVILEASKNKKLISEQDVKVIKRAISKIIPNEDVGKLEYSIEEIIECAVFDKKRDGEFIDIVLVRGINDCIIERMKIAELKGCFL